MAKKINYQDLMKKLSELKPNERLINNKKKIYMTLKFWIFIILALTFITGTFFGLKNLNMNARAIQIDETDSLSEQNFTEFQRGQIELEQAQRDYETAKKLIEEQKNLKNKKLYCINDTIILKNEDLLDKMVRYLQDKDAHSVQGYYKEMNLTTTCAINPRITGSVIREMTGNLKERFTWLKNLFDSF